MNGYWSKGDADASYQETTHEITDRAAHTGQFCEHIQVTADNGTYIHYLYPSDRAAICDELNASVWIKANRPGIRLMARVVLPRERDPNNLDARLTTVLRGDAYQLTGRWQRLELRRPVKLAKEQQQLMRAELKRDQIHAYGADPLLERSKGSMSAIIEPAPGGD